MRRASRGRRGHGGRTREDILTAAERILLRTGSEEAVSVRAVADAVGVTPPSIYRHFPDKAHLIFEVCARQFDRMAAEVLAAAGTGADPVARLAAAGRAYARFGIENPEHYRIMFMGHADHTPDLYADEHVLETGSFGLVVDLARQAIEDGRLRPELTDPVAVAHALWAAIHGVVSLAVAKPSLPAPPLDERIESMIDLILHGITRPAAPSDRPR